MPFVLIIFGILLLSTAFKGNTGDLTDILKKDLTGTAQDVMAIVAILGVGAIGFVPKLKTISDSFLVLILVSMMLADKGGFFRQFQAQLKSLPVLGGVGIRPIDPTQSTTPTIQVPGLQGGFDSNLSDYGIKVSDSGIPIISATPTA